MMIKDLYDSIDSSKLILFDADVIIHFITGDRLLDLFNIMPNDSVIHEKVHDELCANRNTKKTLDNLKSLGFFSLINFGRNYDMIREYAHITSVQLRGAGESACMAYCRYSDDIIASSNLKDIKNYCNLHNMQFLTTFDFIGLAYHTGKWTEDQCNNFINKLVGKHKIPYKNLQDYLKSL
ncbi:hypothetical protein [Zunongwangia endophytica]|uniref:PIN domain-containing protein n=1 Tax=Zunongwangia endophytica TaxID=1808945 RepID=A0ABV8H555_9FLAO|nr:hypothetical protein [Zunongwangia endophytica]MDN3595338.1 hypothetical protein [Zunongwangia endophytica]